MPGEWHAVVHFLQAVHALWFGVLGVSFVRPLGKGPEGVAKSIKAKWTSVEVYDHYDRARRVSNHPRSSCVAAHSARPPCCYVEGYWQLITVALVRHLAAVVPPYYLANPSELQKAVKNNPTARLAVSFLYDFGLPYLRVIQGVRAGESDVLDLMLGAAVAKGLGRCGGPCPKARRPQPPNLSTQVAAHAAPLPRDRQTQLRNTRRARGLLPACRRWRTSGAGSGCSR